MQRFALVVYCCMLIVTLAAGIPSTWARQDPLPDRSEIAAALQLAESARASYRLKSTLTYHYPLQGVTDVKRSFRRLSDGAGRFRRERWYGTPEQFAGPDSNVELECWNRQERRVDQHGIGSAESLPHMVSISPDPISNDYMDEVENVLGLGIRCPATDKFPRLSPGAAIADSQTPITISSVQVDNKQLIRVRLDGPWSGMGNAYIYDFDPQRGWLTVGIEIRIYGTEEQKKADESPYIMYYHTTKADEINGVWMPRVVEMLTKEGNVVDGDLKWTDYLATMHLDSIEINPPVQDSDFTIPLDGMPDGTAVGDSRFGISYKLGQNLLYADGILHETLQPIRHEIDAGEVEVLLASSKPLIDPDLGKLKPLNHEILSWVGRLAGATAVGLLVMAGVVVYRRHSQVGG